ASHAELLHRFLDVLSAQTDKLTGVQHYLARRFEELRSPARSLGRTVGLLDDLSDDDYDAAIRELIGPPDGGKVLDMLPLGPDVQRKVFEQLRQTRERWKNVHTLADLTRVLAEGGEAPPQIVVDEFARDLADACAALLAGFHADTSALERFAHEEADKRTRQDCLRTYSAPFLRMARTGDLQEIDTPTIRRLGVACSASRDAEAFRRQLEMGGGNQLV